MINKLFLLLFSLFLLHFSQTLLANDLLRLFTTPAERQALETELHKRRRTETRIPSPTDQPPRYITFDGLVTRSQGPSTIWLNKHNNLYQQGFTVKLDNTTQPSVSIVLSNTKKPIFLKPGQTVDTLDGTIKENYEHSLTIQELSQPK
jgi:hypothetical protein